MLFLGYCASFCEVSIDAAVNSDDHPKLNVLDHDCHHWNIVAN